MALSDGLGIQALVQSYDKNAVSKAFTEIASQLNKSVDELNDDLNKIKIDKDVVNNLVNQLRALPEEVRKKTQGMSFDLFSDLINANGAEEKIDEAFKLFSNKMQSFVKLRDQIGNDEIIIKADYSQIDELIGKTEKLLELQKELDKWQKEASPRTKVSIEGDISNLESEIKSGIANLNVSGEQVGVGVNVDNEALTELDKKIKETEESLKSAREEAEKYGGSLKDLKDKINETYDKSINKDNQKNADAFRKSVIDYKKAGGSEKDLSKDILSWYKLSESSWPKNFVPLDQISNNVDDVQKKIKELEKTLMGLYKQRESLTKGSIVDTEGIGSDESKIKDQEQEIGRLKDKLQQINQKYAEQSNLVDELKNKLKALEGINNPKVIETDEYKNIISELETAKNKASEFQNEMNELRQTVEVLKSSLSSYNTGNVVPRQDFENANRVIDNLSNKINELEISLTETKNKFTSLSEEVTKLQQDKSDLSGQLSQQKEINAAQQEQISNSQKIKIELDEIKKKYQELTNSIKEMESTQSRYMSLLDKFGQAEAFNKAIQNVDYNEGRNTPEGFVNFDYLDKAKQKLQETGNAYEKATKAAVYYYQYLQKGGTEKIFNKDGKDISGELINLYKEMSSLADTKTGQISYESINKTVREYANELRLAKEEQSREKELINQKNKELKETLSLEKNIAKTKQENQKTEEQTKDTTVKSSGKKNMSKEEFIEFSIARQRKQQVNQEDSSNISQSLQRDSSSIISEQQALNNLEQAIKSVTIAIVEKNKAIQAEEVQMDLSIDQEIKKLEELKGKLEEIKTEFQNGIANGLFKYNENQNGNEQGDKELNVSKIPVEPLLIQSEWEAEIDKILKAIGTKKIKIEPDISSKAWNSFKTFVDNISKQVINLKVVDKGSYGLPSDLKASYTNSTKYVTDLYKVEEKIAQAKESGNQKDLERLATLEAEKKKYEDLLRLEEQFRANEKFKDFDTTSQDNALNKLKSTKEQEYQSNRQVAAIRIEEEAYNENQKFDENKKLEKASSLLEQQKAKWEEIQNIRIKISNLDPVNDADEINNLNAQKSSLESELSMIEKELTLYDSLIDKKKQSNELDKIAANADKQVNDNTLDRVNKLYNDYVNNISEQAQLELKGGNRTDEEEQRLVQLRQEYLDLIEKINKALTEEQNKTSAISKVLESMKIAKDLGVSGVLRNNDVDQGYEEANKVNNALNEAEKKMEDLEKLGQTDLFKQAFSEANNEIKNLNQQLISGEITLTEYNKKVKEITTSLSKKTNAVAFFDPGDMEKTAQQMKDLAQQLPGLREDTIKWGAGNKSLTAIFQDQNGEWKKLTLNAQTAEKVITATFTNAQKPATTFSKFIDELGAKFRNLGSYLLSFVGFYEIWGQIKQGVTYVKELDTALTEMRKVSDETVESLREFQEVSFDIADSVASTAKEIQNSTADWMGV